MFHLLTLHKYLIDDNLITDWELNHVEATELLSTLRHKLYPYRLYNVHRSTNNNIPYGFLPSSFPLPPLLGWHHHPRWNIQNTKSTDRRRQRGTHQNVCVFVVWFYQLGLLGSWCLCLAWRSFSQLGRRIAPMINILYVDIFKYGSTSIPQTFGPLILPCFGAPTSWTNSEPLLIIRYTASSLAYVCDICPGSAEYPFQMPHQTILLYTSTVHTAWLLACLPAKPTENPEIPREPLGFLYLLSFSLNSPTRSSFYYAITSPVDVSPVSKSQSLKQPWFTV